MAASGVDAAEIDGTAVVDVDVDIVIFILSTEEFDRYVVGRAATKFEARTYLQLCFTLYQFF